MNKIFRTACQETFINVDIITKNSAKTKRLSLIDEIFLRLSRVTSNGKLIPEIDGLRFIAIISVIFFHLDMMMSSNNPVFAGNQISDSITHIIAAQGYIGVRLFFAISGFILCLPFANAYLNGVKAPGWKKYLLRRVTRLEPPYIINLIILAAILVIRNEQTFSGMAPHLLASLGYVHNLIYGTGSMINFVAWSLEIEVQFYLLAPLLAMIFLLKNKIIRRSIIGLSIFAILPVQGLSPEFFKWCSLTIIGQIQYFLIGFLLADIYLNEWKNQPIVKNHKWDLIAITAWLLIIPATAFNWYILITLPVLMLIAYIGTFRGIIANKIITNRWLVTIGGMCYTIYLYHEIVMFTIGKYTAQFHLTPFYGINYILQALLIIPPVIIVSSFLFYYLEKPFMARDWPGKWAEIITLIYSTSIRKFYRKHDINKSPDVEME